MLVQKLHTDLQEPDLDCSKGFADHIELIKMGGATLLEVEPANSIHFDLVIGKTLESTLTIRNPRNSTIVFKVTPCKCLWEPFLPNCTAANILLAIHAMLDRMPPDMVNF